MAPSLLDELSDDSSIGTMLTGSDLLCAKAAESAVKKRKSEKPSASSEKTAVVAETDALKPPPVTQHEEGEPPDIVGATMEDVILSEHARNPVKSKSLVWRDDGNNNPENFTRIVSIKGKKSYNIKADDLRKWTGIHTPVGSRKFNKKECFDAIVKEKLNPTPKQTRKKKKDDKLAAYVNKVRYINTIFGRACRNDVATRGESLTAREMTEGIKRDENFHTKIAMEFNKTDLYNDDKFELDEVSEDPSLFTPITWEQSKKQYASATGDYEKAFKNWKHSGNHQAFGEVDRDRPSLEFEAFVNKNKYLLYMHEYAKLYPNILAKMSGNLPKGAFYESIRAIEEDEDDDPSNVATVTPAKKKRGSKAKLGTADASIVAFAERSKKTTVLKNRNYLSQMIATTRDSIAKGNDRRRKLMTEALEMSDSAINLKDVKKRYKQFKDSKNGLAPVPLNRHPSQDTQASYFREMMELVEESVEKDQEEVHRLESELADAKGPSY